MNSVIGILLITYLLALGLILAWAFVISRPLRRDPLLSTENKPVSKNDGVADLPICSIMADAEPETHHVSRENVV